MVFFSKKWSRRTRLRRIGHRHDRGKQSVEMRIEVDREQPIRKKQSTSGTASFSKRHRFEVTVSFFSLHLSIDVRNSETGEGLRVSVQCMNVCSRLSSKVFFSPPPDVQQVGYIRNPDPTSLFVCPSDDDFALLLPPEICGRIHHLLLPRLPPLSHPSPRDRRNGNSRENDLGITPPRLISISILFFYFPACLIVWPHSLCPPPNLPFHSVPSQLLLIYH